MNQLAADDCRKETLRLFEIATENARVSESRELRPL